MVNDELELIGVICNKNEIAKGTIGIKGEPIGGGGTVDYNSLYNKPQINGVELRGNKTSTDLSLQDKLIAGHNITIEDNVISASGEPSEYLKNASKTTNRLVLIKQNDEQVVFNVDFSDYRTREQQQQYDDSQNRWIDTNIEDIAEINSKIPAQATSSNQLADKEFVNSSIQANAANYVTSSAQGDTFATRQALLTGPYYHGGVIYSLKKNDYAIVSEDETHEGKQARYLYDGTRWSFQYTINTTFTERQQKAIDSGATETSINQISINTSNISEINNTLSDHEALINNLDNIKQDKLIAGENITIENNVISATGRGQIYTAGNGLTLNNNEFSIDEQVVATKQDLSEEASIRASNDTILQDNINNEASLRQASDAVLQGNIDNVSDDLSTEQTTREQVDLELQASINTKQNQLTAGANIIIQNDVISSVNLRLLQFAREAGINIVAYKVCSVITGFDLVNIHEGNYQRRILLPGEQIKIVFDASITNLIFKVDGEIIIEEHYTELTPYQFEYTYTNNTYDNILIKESSDRTPQVQWWDGTLEIGRYDINI